jgi:hypothetical protein
MSDILIPTIGRQVVEVPPEYLRMIAVLAETSFQINLGLHCSQCGKDVVGVKNHAGERRWMMECECRTFVGENPMARQRAN